MKLLKICELIEGEILFGDELLDREIDKAYGADLLSDVLAFAQSQTLLLTGLANIQVVRTAEIADLGAIIVVRGKKVENSIIDLAKDCNIPIITSKKTMFECCGLLYQMGLKACGPNDE